MTMTKLSTRREILTYDGYVGMWVDGIQIAAGVRQDDGYAERNGGATWGLWSSGLSLRASASEGVSATAFGNSARAARPLPVRDEQDVRAWLHLLADLAEAGPRAVDSPGGGTKAGTNQERRRDINALVAEVLDEVDAANPEAGYRDYWVALHEQTDDIYW